MKSADGVLTSVFILEVQNLLIRMKSTTVSRFGFVIKKIFGMR